MIIKENDIVHDIEYPYQDQASLNNLVRLKTPLSKLTCFSCGDQLNS